MCTFFVRLVQVMNVAHIPDKGLKFQLADTSESVVPCSQVCGASSTCYSIPLLQLMIAFRCKLRMIAESMRLIRVPLTTQVCGDFLMRVLEATFIRSGLLEEASDAFLQLQVKGVTVRLSQAEAVETAARISSAKVSVSGGGGADGAQVRNTSSAIKSVFADMFRFFVNHPHYFLYN